MTIPRLQALEEVWSVNPPPAITLAVIAKSKGMKTEKRKPKKKAKSNSDDDMREFVTALRNVENGR